MDNPPGPVSVAMFNPALWPLGWLSEDRAESLLNRPPGRCPPLAGRCYTRQ